MSSSTSSRRVRVERNIYQRATGVFEVGFKDSAGVQRWRTVQGGVLAARALRDELLARRGRGETTPPNPRLRFGDAADQWLQGPVSDLRQSTQAGYRNAVEQHLRPRFGARKVDGVTADDLAALVRDMRAAGKSEATIAAALGSPGASTSSRHVASDGKVRIRECWHRKERAVRLPRRRNRLLDLFGGEDRRALCLRDLRPLGGVLIDLMLIPRAVDFWKARY
jgi:Phage integrase, N-terminal SAM-like domain